MNTYYLKKFRKKAKAFHRIQIGYSEISGKSYIIERKENIGEGYILWHWSKVGGYWPFEEAKRMRLREERKFILMEVIKVRNKRLAKL